MIWRKANWECMLTCINFFQKVKWTTYVCDYMTLDGQYKTKVSLYGKYTAYIWRFWYLLLCSTFFCFVLTGIICYAWQCLPFQEKYVANSYKGKVFTKHHRGWEKHIAFCLKEGIKKSFFTFARLSFLVKKPSSEQALTESWRELIKVYKKMFQFRKRNSWTITKKWLWLYIK